MNFLLQDHSERFHMANGLVVELQVLGAASIDLTGMVSISLWNRNSESLIRNRYRLFGTLCLLCVKKKIATKTWIILCVVFCCLFVFSQTNIEFIHYCVYIYIYIYKYIYIYIYIYVVSKDAIHTNLIFMDFTEHPTQV